MLKNISTQFRILVERFLPSAFIFAILLTFIVFVMGLTMTDSSFVDMTTYLVWRLLGFFGVYDANDFDPCDRLCIGESASG